MIVNSVCLHVMTGQYFLLYTSLTGALLGTFGINGFCLTLVTEKQRPVKIISTSYTLCPMEIIHLP